VCLLGIGVSEVLSERLLDDRGSAAIPPSNDLRPAPSWDSVVTPADVLSLDTGLSTERT
jgi:hypothetical protein